MPVDILDEPIVATAGHERRKRLWLVTLVAPISYAVLFAVATTTGRGDTSLELWLTKFPAVVSLCVLVFLLAQRVNEKPARWRAATIMWAAVGVAVIEITSTYALRINEAVNSAAYWRLWPTDESTRTQQHLGSIEPGKLDSSWTVDNVVYRERLTMVALALVAGLVLRYVSQRSAVLTALVLPIAVFVTLVGYAMSTPWSFIPDYDFFVGDSMLGATLFELLVFVAPVDPVSAVGLAVGAVTMALLLAAWGGPATTE